VIAHLDEERLFENVYC